MKITYVGEGIENVSKTEREIGFVLTHEDVKKFGSIFNFLNEKDRDILYLVFLSGKSQSSIQKILNRSQPSLCYDIRRIKERIKFICFLHSVFDIFIDFLENHSSEYDPEVIEILVIMFFTTSYTHVAYFTGRDYLSIRYRFGKALKDLERRKSWSIYEIFVAIRDNLNVVKRIYKKNPKKKIVVAPTVKKQTP